MTDLKFKILKRVHASSVLDPVSKADFYRKTRKINLYKKAIKELVSSGLLSVKTGSDTLLITLPGIQAMEAEAERRSSFRSDSARYWITTAISVLALAISVIALLSQLGLLPLPRY